MEPISVITGQMAPLPRANVDTDAIIPKQYLKRVERRGFGPFLFYEWAYDEEGELIPEFILNQPDYAAAEVLVSGPNFGSGSSREHAPWSIEDRGFKAIIAPSFADIFYNNCINIGLLPVTLTDKQVATLTQIAEDPDNLVTIDLEAQKVTTIGFEAHFDIDPFVKHRLGNGLDNIALTLTHEETISSYEAARADFKPVLS